MRRSRLSVRSRLLLVLCALVSATLIVGITSWLALMRASERLERLHDDTLASVAQALDLSQKASELATRAPYLLTLDSPFLLQKEVGAARDLLAEISGSLTDPNADMLAILTDMDAALIEVLDEMGAVSVERDLIARLNAQTAAIERALIQRASTEAISQDLLTLQRLARALIGVGRAESLFALGEFHREFFLLSQQIRKAIQPDLRPKLDQLWTIAMGPEGLIERRRLELTHEMEAETAMTRIRSGAEQTGIYAAQTNAAAQDAIAQERQITTTAISFAKGLILLVVLVSAGVAVGASFFVSGYVSANLSAISEAMMRLATGDRSSRLPRGEHGGDEIGTLFHAFRAFRANTLRLDRSYRQLAQRNAVFESLYEGMSDGLAILSESGRVIARNSRLAKALRLTSDAVVGRPKLETLLAQGQWHHQIGAEGLAELVHPEGHVLELREGRLPTGGAVILFTDISERRFLEEQLRQAQRSEALGKIAGEVAHDFANILSTISTNIHLLETASPERALHLRQSLSAAIELGTALTQRLLAFARRMHLEPEVMDLNTLVEGIEDLISLALDESIALHISPAPQPLLVQIDPGQMESALLNLCLNAGQAIATKAEGAAYEGRIEISLTRASETMVQLDVRDNGCGMTPEVLAHATEPFFTARADGTGTGLGLATVYGFIRQSGGDVVIESRPDQGSVIRLLLPLAETSRIESLPMLDLGRVLLVEDDPLDAALARRVVGPQRELREARDLHTALQAIADGPAFDLVLSDLHVQGEAAGWRIAEAALMHSPKTRVIVVSGRLPAHDPLREKFPGRAFCLPKPIDPAAFVACLEGLTSDDHST